MSSAARGHSTREARGTELDAAVAADPSSARLRLERAELRRLAGDLRGAARDLARARKADPELLAVDLAEATLGLQEGRPAAALALLARPLASTGSARSAALVLRARALSAAGSSEAAAAWSEAFADSPSVQVAAAWADAAPDVLAERRALETAVAVLGDVPTLVVRLVEAQLATGDAPAARARLARPMLGWMPGEREALLARAERTEEKP